MSKLITIQLTDLLVGWAAIFNTNYGRETHFLIAPEYRRRKLGTTLYRRCKGIEPETCVIQWSYEAESFARAVECRALKSEDSESNATIY